MERLPQLDVFRAIAILAVLNVHASSYAAGVQAMDSPIYYVYNFMNIFFKYGTPSFIFLSGFVLFYNYYDRPVNIRLISKFYQKRLKYIVLPYTIASICYFVFNNYMIGQLTGVPLSELWLGFRNAWLTGTAHGHLYFVFISIQFYILFPLIIKLLQSKQWLVQWAIPLALALQWGFVFVNKFSLHMPNKGSLAITYLVYYVMGAYIAIHFDRIKPWLMNAWDQLTQGQKRWMLTLWITWFVTACIHVQLWHDLRSTGNSVNTLWYELLWNMHTMLSALVLLHAAFLIYRKASRRVVSFLTRIGELSFAIYLLHPVVIALYRRFRYGIQPESIAYFFFIIGGLLVALFLSWAIIHVCFKRIPWSWALLGRNPDLVSLKNKRSDIDAVKQRNRLNP